MTSLRSALVVAVGVPTSPCALAAVALSPADLTHWAGLFVRWPVLDGGDGRSLPGADCSWIPPVNLPPRRSATFVRRWPGLVITLVADPVNQLVGVVFPVAPVDVLQEGSDVGGVLVFCGGYRPAGPSGYRAT